MGKETGIAWTNHTWNPWQGCRKVSPGCANCYMYRDKKRFGQDPEKVIRSASATFNAPLHWKEPARVFVCSWSDFFIEDADPWREEAWEIMRKTPHLTYQILTKRPENIVVRLPEGWPFRNVWLGVTAENQDMADLRIPFLMSTSAVLRFVSIEPMIGEISLSDLCIKEGEYSEHHFSCLWNDLSLEEDELLGGTTLDWVIVGGETGPNAREMNPEWAKQVLIECEVAKTPFFMKQMANKDPIPDRLNVRQFPQP